MNSIMRYWNDWNPEALASEARNDEYSAGVSVASTSHDWLSCAMIRATRASILKAGCRSSARMRSRAAASSCSMSFIQSSVAWCCTMKSISL